MQPRPPSSPLFPYTTLFRSQRHANATAYLDLAAAAELTRIKTPWVLGPVEWTPELTERDRKSTRLNSSHTVISYAVFCLKKKKSRLVRTYREVARHPVGTRR